MWPLNYYGFYEFFLRIEWFSGFLNAVRPYGMSFVWFERRNVDGFVLKFTMSLKIGPFIALSSVLQTFLPIL